MRKNQFNFSLQHIFPDVDVGSGLIVGIEEARPAWRQKPDTNLNLKHNIESNVYR